MACNNFSTKNNQLNKPQKTPSNVHFDNISKKLPKQDQQYENTKCRPSTFAEKQKHNNTAVWQIDSLEKLLAKIDKDLKEVVSMILDMQSIYTKYLNKTNKVDKKRNKIYTRALRFEQEFYISNEKREQIVFLLQQQIVKAKRYKKMFDALQNLAFAKWNKLLLSIKNSIDQQSSIFTHVLLPLINSQSQNKNKHPT